ncbi:heavy metal translocating P-type ATPase metal-binding domain-containing protein [Emticicia sp. BO119]|uniref:heavy metal translocating P-type ATPase n=1 Tax=Emticicia sp. BO119 TaxID=2757768 RepID=UPI0015F0E809|nr:heavy metal translocating P-type ATPase metal-binding domain-containing protein [Emticicia sp. BO119]MBA4848890.1 heavy metal translocating P-type ATPase metal-binding domain-containing protein [Emticicia sp. BO119]
MTLNDTRIACYHCGDDCADSPIVLDDKHFCCHGCKTVYEILQDNNLCSYYDLNQNAGISLKAASFNGRFDYLADEKIQTQLLDFQSVGINKVTLFIPAIHCSSCVWLLENFNKIQTGIFTARLNFLRKELSLSYDPSKVNLQIIVELLATLGYEPLINLQSVEHQPKQNKVQRRLILQIGVVGFCMGNVMLLSFPEYFKLDLNNIVDATYQRFFLYLNFLLSLPVFFFGASDYLKGAIISIKENLRNKTTILSVDIPIALGITALFVRSSFETFVNHSAGYWDSLAGLVFFLLTGKWVQQVTYNYLSFERNYKSYFPLAVKVKNAFKNVSELQKGDIIDIHHQELIPADSLLLSDRAYIDYSFVTGESEPIKKEKGELIYAGGRLIGEKVHLTVQKQVSQSYLTELWNNDAFKKEKKTPAIDLANAFSKYFTYTTLLIASVTGIYWYFHQPDLVWTSVTAVLMVACPCALTLSMPFTMNTAMGIFGRNKFFVKNQMVVQLMTEIDEVVFDKTGTLTENKNGQLHFADGYLNEQEKSWIGQLAAQSMHPLSKMIYQHLGIGKGNISYFNEIKGMGIEGVIDGNFIRLGNAEFIGLPATGTIASQVNVEINREYKGYFTIKSEYRKNWKDVLEQLQAGFKMALLSGDNDEEKNRLNRYFHENRLLFNQKPQDKLNFIKKEQEAGHHVLMIGDGLNDAGALRQSNVGIALSEDVQAFSPACDAILDASNFSRLTDFLRFSKTALNIVKASFILSLVYNFIGIGWAVSGQLSPVMAAIFMPLSSLSVVLFAVGTTYLFAKLKKLI